MVEPKTWTNFESSVGRGEAGVCWGLKGGEILSTVWGDEHRGVVECQIFTGRVMSVWAIAPTLPYLVNCPHKKATHRLHYNIICDGLHGKKDRRTTPTAYLLRDALT